METILPPKTKFAAEHNFFFSQLFVFLLLLLSLHKALFFCPKVYSRMQREHSQVIFVFVGRPFEGAEAAAVF